MAVSQSIASVTLVEERERLSSVRSRAKRRRLDLELSAERASKELPSLRAEVDTEIETSAPASTQGHSFRPDKNLTALQNCKRLAYGSAYVPEEEALRSDLCQHYVNTGQRPQNFLLNWDSSRRFEEYPRLRKLLDLHSALVSDHAIPATILHTELPGDLKDLLPFHFDSILVNKPDSISWEALATLPIPVLSSSPSFIWIWCGDGADDGLEKGRALLTRWGFRRCEDIVWLKTNRSKGNTALLDEPLTNTLLTHTKEHCLMGIKGTVRRSTDGHFAHCNVDTDVIVWEGDKEDPTLKPPELYHIIENFCLGNRRLEIFANRPRRGWLSVVNVDVDIAHLRGGDGFVEFASDQWHSYFGSGSGTAALTVPNPPEIDNLRPRSPPHFSNTSRDTGYSGGGIGRGSHRPSHPAAFQSRSQQAQTQAWQQPDNMMSSMAMPMPMPMSMSMPMPMMMNPMFMNPMMMMNPAMFNPQPGVNHMTGSGSGNSNSNTTNTNNSNNIDWAAFFGSSQGKKQ